MSNCLVEKTLLIDDSEIDLFIQKRLLEHYHFANELVTYRSAGEALEWLQNNCENGVPEIIFLDLNMPEIDGFAFMENFKTLPKSIIQNSRIVVLTSSDNQRDRQHVMAEKSVIQYITKPLKNTDIEELRLRLA
jgi:two-component system, NarL family, nitrate/nitrite response regulator NarL